MYRAIDVARYIIWYCKQRGYSISNLKLQKILYFVQAEFLVNENRPCFKEEIEAWDFGPVVPEVYHEFKIFGSADIPKVVCGAADEVILERDQVIINEMVDECGEYSAARLVEITHNQAPWKEAYEKYCNNIIRKEAIKRYFEKE